MAVGAWLIASEKPMHGHFHGKYTMSTSIFMMKGTITSMRTDGRGIWQERVNGGQVLAKRAARPKHHPEGDVHFAYRQKRRTLFFAPVLAKVYIYQVRTPFGDQMAGKKARKKARYESASKEECSCCAPGASLPDWLLLLVGGFGLVHALGWADWPVFTSGFNAVWPVLVIVIAAKNLMEKKNCSC